ncbi:APC family permease [Nocardioides pocheonensis]|uniref:APC family permease n=1 Tax=Nocardioides pocheonensis TaxID=661485 RepID=A0A3N0GXY1_9ACTN|nr:APC family permease [Nocardioides pocheonensis]RNM17066.1 APC family permease [Nocardioides pocheonensis]
MSAVSASSTSSVSEPSTALAGGGTTLRADSVGTVGVAATVISAAAPLTVMAGVAPIALAIGGVGVPGAYLLAGIVLSIFAIGFTAMAATIRRTGGFFVYIGHAFGGTAGFAAAVLALVSYNLLQIGVYGLFGIQTRAALDDLFGFTAPWWVISAIAVVVVFILGAAGIDVGAKVLVVLITLESAILAIMGVSIVLHGGAHGLGVASFNPDNIFNSGVLAVLGICFAAFMGFESTALYRAEARDPARTIPRATYAAVAFMALFYCFISWTVVQALGQADVQAGAGKQGPALFFATIHQYVGGWAEHAMYLLIVTSVYASQLAFHNAINRYTFGMAESGALPRVFARTNRAGSPAFAGAVQSVLALTVVLLFALFGLDPFNDLLIKVNTPGVIGIILLQALAAAAAVAFFFRRRDVPRRTFLMSTSVVAAGLMAWVIYAVVKHLDVLTGAPRATNEVLVGAVPAILLLGVVGGLVLRSVRPETIALLAHDDAAVEQAQ